jgi:light-independent protochlorophyllide reductase subunit N
MPQVRVLNYSGSGIETTFTQGEDACLAALVPRCRRRTTPSLMVVGALADVVEDQFRAPVRADRHGPGAASFPPRRSAKCRRRAEHPLPAGPALPGRHRPRAGSARRAAPGGAVPARRRRHDGLAAGRRHRLRHQRRPRGQNAVGPRPRTRRRRAGAPPPALAGKRIFFFPDSQLEVPLARFLSRELGMQLTEVGTPYLHREHMAPELALLPAGTTLSRRPGRGQPARPLPRRTRPTSSSAASAWPTRWRPRA